MIAVQLLGFAPWDAYRRNPTAHNPADHIRVVLTPVVPYDSWHRFLNRTYKRVLTPWAHVNEILHTAFFTVPWEQRQSFFKDMLQRNDTAFGVWLVMVDVDPECSSTACIAPRTMDHRVFYRGIVF